MPFNLNVAAWRLFVPKQAVGANLIYFDLFNATGSGVNILIGAVVPIVSGAVAVTGILGVDLFLQRTSAIGTGGTAATLEGTDLTACTVSGMAKGQGALPPGVTARLTPSGGATAGAVISMCEVFTEETGQATYQSAFNEFVRRGRPDVPELLVPPNSGISIVQGSVASVGNIGFDVIFQLSQR